MQILRFYEQTTPNFLPAQFLPPAAPEAPSASESGRTPRVRTLRRFAPRGQADFIRFLTYFSGFVSTNRVLRLLAFVKGSCWLYNLFADLGDAVLTVKSPLQLAVSES